MPNTSIHCEGEDRLFKSLMLLSGTPAAGAPTMREATCLHAALAMHIAASLALAALLAQLPWLAAPQISLMLWPVVVAALFALSAWLWPESRRNLSMTEKGMLWMRSHPSRFRLKVASLLALGTAAFWHWRGMPVFHSPWAYQYFSMMAGVNLFSSLWLLMEGFCQVREWSLRHRPWVRLICAWPVTVLLYAVIVPVVSIFACFGLLLLRRVLNGVLPQTEELTGGVLGKAALVFTQFFSWMLNGENPLGWGMRVLLLMVVPVLLAWECLACLAVLLSWPEPQGVLEEAGGAEPLEDMQ